MLGLLYLISSLRNKNFWPISSVDTAIVNYIVLNVREKNIFLEVSPTPWMLLRLKAKPEPSLSMLFLTLGFYLSREKWKRTLVLFQLIQKAQAQIGFQSRWPSIKVNPKDTIKPSRIMNRSDYGSMKKMVTLPKF